MVCGILSRQTEVSGRIITPYIIYSYPAVQYLIGLWVYNDRFHVPDAINIPYRGTLSPPAFKPYN